MRSQRVSRRRQFDVCHRLGGVRRRGTVLARAVIEGLECRQLLAAGDPVINEFLAVNSSGDDWIEIYNPGQAMDLAGWHLTDDINDLGKWTFPSTTPLGSGEYLIVTADDTQTPPVSGQPLRANFRLGQDGDYLALVRSDGTIAHEYAPVYPRQVSNVSYGVTSASTSNVTLLASGAAGPSAKVLIPTSADQLAPDWNARTFDDSSWPITGQGGVGYDTLVGGNSYDPLVRTD